MKAKKTARDLDTSDVGYKTICAVFNHLLAAGLSKSTLTEMTARALEDTRRTPNSSARDLLGNPVIYEKIAMAFERWYRQRSLIDSEGNPIPLPLYHSALSVEALVRHEGLTTSTRAIVKEILALGLLSRLPAGRYVPARRDVIIRHTHPFVSEHYARSVMRLLQTARQNALVRSANGLLIERCAHVARLPTAKLQAFRDFANQQGEAFIDTVNEWLETNNSASSKATKSRRVTEAGIQVFAFAGKRD
jgi:hypothetical protein